MKSHLDLDVWKKSMDLAKAVYENTKAFPQDEIYGLTSQMRRAAVSIASNIAEGAARGSKKDFARFLDIAQGSAAELETQCFLAQNLKYGQLDQVLLMLQGIRRMLVGLKKNVTRDL